MVNHSANLERQNMFYFPSVPKTINPVPFLCFLIILLCHLADAAPPYWKCSNVSYTDNSRFHKNLGDLLISLPSNASVSKYYNTSTGNDPDRVYGLYMCFDYVANEMCRRCINTAQSDMLMLCPRSKEAVVWEDSCLLRYSNENFFGRLNVRDNIADENSQNISDPKKFESVLNETLNRLAKQAAYNLSAAEMHATEEVAFEDKLIYAFVQCTTDLSRDDCDKCLLRAKEDVLALYYFSVGARLMSRSCYLRFELYAFYTAGASEASAPRSPNKNAFTAWEIHDEPKLKNGFHIHAGSSRKILLITILTVVSACLAILLLGSCVYLAVRKRNKEGRNYRKAQDPYISLAAIHAATSNFSDSNKLGEGGFGPVYKGILNDGREVAIKRLSSLSEQGLEEFTNEVLLIMKLQHKNLVRLCGFCVDGEEKLLAYEFMPNSSLDVILFDSKKRARLDWSRRISIISGIARGILYLHEDSRLRIIHRDLKASNILLDNDMNPKISDFGMARIFVGSEGEANTATIVGTYGYMAPEYAMEGLYSVKSDVFAFGVLLIEIITGRRNAGFHLIRRVPSLIAYAWQLWNEGNGLELMDPLLVDSCDADEFLRYLHIGLLCVQEDADDRPTMSYVVVMLKSETVTLSPPEKPAFSTGRFADHCEMRADHIISINEQSVSDVVPR
ncbi:unnamed protein product [Prunus armeniaca]|uniref:non-specific serine/threonine protein kinase n=1 Tax=Prunus armeniaca TaxID=36596 RepID=A0A6J5XRS0_PRUAR|nr:unnamed protein product [Prunus armeniaca]